MLTARTRRQPPRTPEATTERHQKGERAHVMREQSQGHWTQPGTQVPFSPPLECWVRSTGSGVAPAGRPS